MNNRTFMNLVIVAVITLALVMPMVPNGETKSDDAVSNGTMASSQPEPNIQYGGDWILSYDEKETLNDANNPDIVFGLDETIHVVWDEIYEGIDLKPTSDDRKEIHYSMSKDGGLTWTGEYEDIMISEYPREGRAPIEGNATNPSIAIDSKGILHVVWSELTFIIADESWAWELYYTRSENGGETWTALDPKIGNIPVSREYGGREDAQEISAPNLVSARSDVYGDVLYVTWSEFNEKVGQKIHISKSTNGGDFWSGQETDFAFIPGETASYNPEIIASGYDGEELHVTWSQMGQNELEEIYYSFSYDSGKPGTWSEAPTIVSYGEKPDNLKVDDISMNMDLESNLHVIWSQSDITEPKYSEMYYSGLPKGGKTWTGAYEDSIISTPDGYPAMEPSIGFFEKRVQVVWTELFEESGSLEIHTSVNDNPLDPESKWSGVEKDLVLSNGEDKADAHDVAFELGLFGGEVLPMFVWSELNDDVTRSGRAIQNTEIHTPPPPAPPEWTLSTSVTGNGIIEKNPAQSTYTDGDYVLLTAKADSGWTFSHWELGIGGSTNPYNLLMNGDKSVRAVFTQNTYILTISIIGNGHVSKSPDTATYTHGQVVTLTAIPLAGWSFDHWSVDITGTTNPDTVTMTTNRAVTAWFTQDVYTLSISRVGSGDISSDIDPPYTYGDTVTLTANPDPGWEFDHWEGDISSTTNPDSVTMDGDKSVTCYFTQITHDIALATGWNLVSMPLEQTDTSIATVLSSISGNYERVKYYDTTDSMNPWKSYSPISSPSVNTLSDLDHTMAFWVYMKSPDVFSPTGEYPDSTNITIYPGWNFVGYPSQDKATTITTALTGVSYDIVEGFDADDPAYLTVLTGTDIMMPGTGFWIHATAAGTWTVDW